MMTAKRIGILAMVGVLLLLSTAPGYAQQPENRIIGKPDMVVFLKDDGSLEYYEVIKSVGYQIGVTPPGWRNDRTGVGQLIHSVSRADGARAELRHQQNDIYSVELFNASGGLIERGEFSARGIPGGQGNFFTTTTTTTVQTTPHYVDYWVVRGDTLYKLAVRYHTTIGAIMQANNLTNPNVIYAGQYLRIPQ